MKNPPTNLLDCNFDSLMIPQKRQRFASSTNANGNYRATKVMKTDLSPHQITTEETANYVNNQPSPHRRDLETTKEVPITLNSSSSPQVMDAVLPDSSPKRTGILDLPNDAMTRIFEHCAPVPELCRLMEVCKKFKQVATEPRLWRHVTAANKSARRLHEEEDDENYQAESKDKDVSYVAPLEHDDVLRMFDSDFGSRTPLDTRSTDPKKNFLSLAIDVITSRAGSYLTSLNLEKFYPYSPCPRQQITDADLAVIAMRSSASLQNLHLSPTALISGPGLAQFVVACPRLRVLHMTGCSKISDKVLADIVRLCTTLEDISVSDCLRFRGKSIHTILLPVRNTLKRIDVSGTPIGTLNISGFMHRYPFLETIKANGCPMLEETGRVQSSISALPFPNLVHLDLDKASFVSGAWVRVVCDGARNLRFLSLSMTSCRIPDIQRVFVGSWPPLRYLGLSGQHITDGMWQIIVESLGSSLEQCDLSRTRHLTGQLAALDMSMEVLEELDVRGSGFTTESVWALVTISPKLESLNLSGCRGVHRILRRSPQSFKQHALKGKMQAGACTENDSVYPNLVEMSIVRP